MIIHRVLKQSSGMLKSLALMASACALTGVYWVIAANAQPIIGQSGLGPAGSGTQTLRLESQRFHYQAAKEANQKGDLERYKFHYQQLGNYPLKTYLDYNSLRSGMTKSDKKRSVSKGDINHFLETYPNTFLAMKLRYNALRFYAQTQQWKNFLAFYEPDYNSANMRCLHLFALAKTGDTRRLHETATLWNVNHSQPDSCDPLFKLWKKNKLLTPQLQWSRFNKAMQAGRRSLANYISRSLPDPQLSYASLYKSISDKPTLINDQENFREQRLEIQHIIAHGIQKLARSQPRQALQTWEYYEAQQLFPEPLRLTTKLEIIKQLTRNGFGQEAQRLLSYSHSLRNPRVVEEVIRDGLANLDWTRVISGIDLLSQDKQRAERWRYWRARAMEQLRLTHDQNLIRTTYEELSQNRSFYGFLAADRLDKSYSLEDATSSIPEYQLSRVAQIEGLKRSYELWLLGNLNEARAEWLYTAKSLSNDELLIAAELAKKWGWYNGGIQAVIKGNYWDQLSLRFPLAYKEDVHKTAQDVQLDPTLIFAIARQESAFDHQARSSAGAMGLMQLMPATARQTAKKTGITYKKSDLYRAKNNIKLGSAYLSELMLKYNGNRILATAAYNAGPHRVKRWLNTQDQEQLLPFDAWIETIPFRETRRYVKNVLAYTVIYGYRLGESRNMITQEEAKRPL